MTGLLSAIVAATRARLALRPFVAAPGRDTAMRRRPPDGERFVRMLMRRDSVNVVAECKRQSPSGGVLCREYDAAQIASAYERAGAAAVSVITEPEFFAGTLDDLRAVCAAVALPVLRKDFIVDERQLTEAADAGADAALLIVGAVSDAELRHLIDAARALRLAALVEVHDEGELDRALSSGADLIGVNARNLRTLQVERDTLHRLAPRIPSTVVHVAESGIRSRAEIERLRDAGYHAFLVGERLMRSQDPGAALEELLGS
jgi:indole-3-glycerol phosphate synthase